MMRAGLLLALMALAACGADGPPQPQPVPAGDTITTGG